MPSSAVPDERFNVIITFRCDFQCHHNPQISYTKSLKEHLRQSLWQVWHDLRSGVKALPHGVDMAVPFFWGNNSTRFIHNLAVLMDDKGRWILFFLHDKGRWINLQLWCTTANVQQAWSHTFLPVRALSHRIWMKNTYCSVCCMLLQSSGSLIRKLGVLYLEFHLPKCFRQAWQHKPLSQLQSLHVLRITLFKLIKLILWPVTA